MFRKSLKYTFLTFKLDGIYLSVLFLGLFVIICLFQLEQEHLYDMSRAYLGVVIPMVGGIMGAYSILDDPVLELRFATPIRMERLLFERFTGVFLLQTVCAVVFQIFIYIVGGDLSGVGSQWHVQLAWVIPTVSMIALGVLTSLMGKLPIIGTAITSLVWLIELLARGWLAHNNGKYFLVFMGALMSDHPDILANQIVLAVVTVFFMIISWMLLRKQERYI